MHIFRHIAQLSLDKRRLACAQSVQSDKKSDFAIRAQALCGIALDVFFKLLTDKSSYFRIRGAKLIISNAKWDTDNIIDKNIDTLLFLITDEKPTAARQLIHLLPKLANAKPRLRDKILSALINADTSIYRESMRPLVDKDITEALAKIR